MQFKQPEVLYALILLLIPIFIHLFQLRRFRKIEFTNVAFLKKVTTQTRKSSRIKKWITLMFRLFALACIILAFAQPFSAEESALDTDRKTVLYIDNSFSMQAKGANGPMLKRALQQLYDNLNEEGELSWFTNNDEFRSVSMEDFRSEILKTDYTGTHLDNQSVVLRASELMSGNDVRNKRLIYVSDLQQTSGLPEIPGDLQLEIVQMKPVSASNISIDTAYLESGGNTKAKLIVQIKAQGEIPQNVPVSLYSDNSLAAKVGADLSNSDSARLTFDLDLSEGFQGKLEINESNILYDNSLYFSVNPPEQIKVLAINEAESTFLNRLYSAGSFSYSEQSSDNLNYSDIVDQNFVILNQLNTIPSSLRVALIAFTEAGGSLTIIPSKNADINSYNQLLQELEIGRLEEFQPGEKRISEITFSHPLYDQVFEKEVGNFQYPTVGGAFRLSSISSPALRFDDESEFLVQKDKFYFFTAPIDTENSNFQNSPLIVPTFYNMAQLSLPLPKIYMEVSEPNDFTLPLQLGPDEIVRIGDSISEFIPLQQNRANSVEIRTLDEPKKAGNYRVYLGQQPVSYISYNYRRDESLLTYHDAEDWEGARTFSSIESLFDVIGEENNVNTYWKWFVILAVLFLFAEMLILKFYKN